MSSKLKIFGVPMSQAVRTVLWMMLYKKLPFELIITAPGSPKENGTRHPSYLEKYPNGTIPGLEDPETGYLLSESIAIMCYLCNKHKWDDLYPEDPELRGEGGSLSSLPSSKHQRSFSRIFCTNFKTGFRSFRRSYQYVSENL